MKFDLFAFVLSAPAENKLKNYPIVWIQFLHECCEKWRRNKIKVIERAPILLHTYSYSNVEELFVLIKLNQV